MVEIVDCNANWWGNKISQEKRNLDESPSRNPYASPKDFSKSCSGEPSSARGETSLEQASCFFVLMLLMSGVTIFVAFMFYNPLAPPAAVYRSSGFMFSIAFAVAAIALMGVGTIVFYIELRKKREAR